MISRTTSATAHPAVPTQMTSWSSASSGGGGAGRSARSRVSFIPLGYEVEARPGGLTGAARPGGLHRLRERDVLSPRPRPADEGTHDDSNADQDRCGAGHGPADLREQAGEAPARPAHHVGHDRGGALRDAAGRAVR